MSETPSMPQGGRFGQDLFTLEQAADHLGLTEDQVRMLIDEDETPVSGLSVSGDAPVYTSADLERLRTLAQGKGWGT